MGVCPVCGALNVFPQCDGCIRRYEKDIAERHIPQQFIEAGIDFTYSDWSAVKEIEKSAANRGYSFEKRKAVANEMIQCRLNIHRAQLSSAKRTAAQMQAEQDDEISKNCTY